jgi:hypothetical protein
MRQVKAFWKDGIAGALALALAMCVGSDAQATTPAPRLADVRVAAHRVPELPAHLRGLDTSKIVSRVVYRSSVPGGGAWQGGQPLLDPRSALLLGSGLMALGILARRLRRK